MPLKIRIANYIVVPVLSNHLFLRYSCLAWAEESFYFYLENLNPQIFYTILSHCQQAKDLLKVTDISLESWKDLVFGALGA